jgi:hypothetical protein
MRIRDYTPGDLEALKHLHASQGFGYPLPDLDSPLFVTKLILEDESTTVPQNANGNGEVASREAVCPSSPPNKSNCEPRIVMAAFLRLTAEAYLLHDASAGTPRQRWQNLLALHEAACHDAAARGLDDVQAFLPPRVARAFGRRLSRLGWRHDPWPCFSRVTALP